MVTMTIRLPAELHAKLKKEAKKRGISINALILNILWDWEHNVKSQ